MNRGFCARLGRAFKRVAVPLAAYYAVTLALPLANGAAKSGGMFVKHAFVVLVMPPVAITVAFAGHAMARALAQSITRVGRNRVVEVRAAGGVRLKGFRVGASRSLVAHMPWAKSPPLQ